MTLNRCRLHTCILQSYVLPLVKPISPLEKSNAMPLGNSFAISTRHWLRAPCSRSDPFPHLRSYRRRFAHPSRRRRLDSIRRSSGDRSSFWASFLYRRSPRRPASPLCRRPLRRSFSILSSLAYHRPRFWGVRPCFLLLFQPQRVELG